MKIKTQLEGDGTTSVTTDYRGVVAVYDTTYIQEVNAARAVLNVLANSARLPVEGHKVTTRPNYHKEITRLEEEVAALKKKVAKDCP